MATLTKSLLPISGYTNQYYTYQCVVTENSYSVANNTSNVTITFSIKGPWAPSFYDWTTYYGIAVDGVVKKTGSSAPYISTSYVNLLTWTGNITHNSNGSKSINVGVYLYHSGPSNYLPKQYTSSSLLSMGSVTLTNIPRQATISSAPNFNDEQNPTITYSNPAGNSVTSLQACISFTGAKDDISYRDISKTGTSYTFNLTDNERNILRNSIPDNNSITVYFYVRTIIGGVSYHSTLGKTFTITNGAPTFSSSNLSYYDSNSSISSITGNNTIIVRNKSNLMVTYTAAAAKKGATISKYSFTVNGVTKTSTTAGGTINFGVINSASNLTLSANVVDSRGNYSSTVYKTITCYDHYAPYFTSFNAYRADADGTANTNGQYLKCVYRTEYAKVNNTNSVTVNAYYTTGTTTKKATESNNAVLVNLKETSKTYNVYLQIVDKYNAIGTSSSTTVFGSSRALNVSKDGTGVAIGKMADQNKLFDVRWKSQFRSDVIIDGNLVATGLLKVTEFYSGSTSNTITKTLATGDSIDNYKYLEIFYTDNYNNGHNSVKVSSPNGRQVDLSLIEVADNTPTRTYIRRTMYTIVGDGNTLTITPSSTARGCVQIDNTTIIGTETNQNYIKIIKVLGYK